MADEPHDTATVSDSLWRELAEHWTPPQPVELLVLAGWSRAISYVCNAAQVPLEDCAPRWPAQ